MSCNGVRHFDVDKDVPDLSGKVALVTGGNSGLGKQTVIDLAKHNPHEIILTARSADKAEVAIKEIKEVVPTARITFLQVDLNSLASVQQAAKTVLASNAKIDILILNAGIMCTPPGLTADGYETQFGTNHLAHALLTKLLLPVLLQAPEPRVVVLSSDMQSQAPTSGILFPSLNTNQEDISTIQRYGQSKLANILFARGLAKHYPRITAASVHPGIFRTNLQTSMKENSAVVRIAAKVLGGLMADPSKGTRNQLWAATAKEVKNGEYYLPVGVSGKGSKAANDEELAEKLWKWTEDELKKWEIQDLQ
jgi:NAD(P)-dependent dehydrogenase (short-subunit alcohol dehydrogenase family)